MSEMDTTVLDKAIGFAARAHAGQVRKGTSTPYILHPLEAAAICATVTDDLEVLAAAVLHDVVEDTGISIDQVEEEIPGVTATCLCGPSHAEEVSRRIPTTIVAGARKKETAEAVRDLFMNPVFRVYTSPDMLGMELGASIKNVIALAAGMADGLGYGDNTKAALITRGIAEMTRLGVAMGASEKTFGGLTGIGDLIVTCASMHSRNRRAGILIGQGKTADEAMKEVKQVVEGVYSAKAAKALAEKYGVQMPIVEQVNRILFENKSPKEAVRDLMMRDPVQESADLEWKE